MKRYFTILFTLLVMGALTGCASHRYTIVEPPSKSLADFSILEISEFKTNLNDAESRELADRFAGRLHLAVIKYRENNPEDHVYDEVTLNTEKTRQKRRQPHLHLILLLQNPAAFAIVRNPSLV